jgi:phage baseplate assembly protein V
MDINRLLDPIMRRVRLIISRGKVTGVTDGHKTQNLQVSLFANETMDDVERLIEYGLISVPPAGSQTVVAFSAGVRAHPVALVVADGRTRPTGQKTGDSGLYHLEGHQILLTENGEIVITCKKLRFEVEEDVTTNCKNWSVNASESASITSAAISLNGSLEMFAQDGESDSTATLHGDLNMTGTSTAEDHISGGHSGATHGHGGVERGDGETDGPT